MLAMSTTMKPLMKANKGGTPVAIPITKKTIAIAIAMHEMMNTKRLTSTTSVGSPGLPNKPHNLPFLCTLVFLEARPAILPINVPSPVCTIMSILPVSWVLFKACKTYTNDDAVGFSVDHQRAAEGQVLSLDDTLACALGDHHLGLGFTGHGGTFDFGVGGPNDTKVRGHFVADLNVHDVALDEVAGVEGLFASVSNYFAVGRQQGSME